jgi:hypothetical protein
MTRGEEALRESLITFNFCSVGGAGRGWGLFLRLFRLRRRRADSVNRKLITHTTTIHKTRGEGNITERTSTKV